jgi:hypothetical protein
MTFVKFYRTVFLAEHQSLGTAVTHVLGTLLSTIFIPWALYYGHEWWLLAYPLVHAVPGLIGHRIFERNAAVGDTRITRKDYSLLWFIWGNHLMTYELFTGKLAWPSRRKFSA